MVRTPLTHGQLVRRTTTAGTALAIGLTLHSAVNLRTVRRPPTPAPTARERVSVLLPLRDEAARVTPTLRSLLAQRGVPDLEILVLDDGSTDGTADVVRSVTGADPRVRLIDGGHEPLPDGWLGKPWACQRLAEQATGSALVFVDADVVLTPEAIAGTVALLRESALDLVSPYPRQIAVTPAERLVQPLVVWSWLTTLSLAATERSPRPSLAAANGQLLAVDAVAYHRIGGHSAVRDLVLEDIGLLRAFKRNGFRGVPADGSRIAECRMYDGAAELVDGYTKSLWSAFGSPAGALGAIGLLSLAYVAPAAGALLSTDKRTRRVGLAGYAAGVAGRILIARQVGARVAPDCLLHPLSVLAFGALTGESLRRRRAGQLSWKGRPVH